MSKYIYECFAKISLFAAMGFSSISMASVDACALVSEKSRPVVILLNSNGAVVRKGVDLGGMAYGSDFEAEYFKINTGYKIIAYPGSIFFDVLPSGVGYVGLEKVAPICPGAATYKVNLHMNFEKGDARPYKFRYKFPNVMVEDHPSSPAREANEIFYFNPEVFGTIVQPAK